MNTMNLVFLRLPRLSHPVLRSNRNSKLLSCIAAVFVCIAGASFARADIPSAKESAGTLIRELLQGEIAKTQRTSMNGFGDWLASYDLANETDAVMKMATSEPEFHEFVRARTQSLTPAQLKSLGPEIKGGWIMEYVQKREDIEPDIKAWLKVFAVYLPWDEAMTGYQLLEKHRSGDFLPKLMMLSKPQRPGGEPRTSKQWNEWIDILEHAVRLAATPEQECDCALWAGLGTTKMKAVDASGEASQRIWKCVREIEVPNWIENSEALNLGKLLIAIEAKDFEGAIALSRQSRLITIEPMLLIFAGKRDEAFAALHALRRNRTLSEGQRSGIESMEPLILVFSHRLAEARRVIDSQRTKLSLTSQQSQFLDVAEKTLKSFEAVGIRTLGAN